MEPEKKSKPLQQSKPDREAEEEVYLGKLGERVRSLRTQRGMTRRILTQYSGISERYLAQLEGGKGNASILLLRRVADAIGHPLDDLVHDGPERPIDEQLMLEHLRRLSPAEREEARQLLRNHFNDSGAASTLRVSLVGLRGAGKSTLGKGLADKLGVPFVELNRLIEAEYGAGVGEILGLSGQRTYRRFERKVLQRVLADYDRVIIATGGGIVTEPATLDILLRNTVAVWLQAQPEEHMSRVIDQGDLRPMSDNREAMEDLKEILNLRSPFYKQAALTLNTSGRTVEQSLADLVRLVTMRLRVPE